MIYILIKHQVKVNRRQIMQPQANHIQLFPKKGKHSSLKINKSKHNFIKQPCPTDLQRKSVQQQQHKSIYKYKSNNV